MKQNIKLLVVVALFGAAIYSMPSIGQTDAYTCIDRHPNGVEVWGCYQGEPYWNIAEYAGEQPMISGGTLYMPSRAKKPMGMGGRIVDNAVWNAKWRTEAEINRKVENKINDIMRKVF